MTNEPKPQPNSRERPDASDKGAETAAVTTTHPNLEQEEEEAARLGDFA